MKQNLASIHQNFFDDDCCDESVKRHVTELDLAAYDKDEFTISMEKNIMKRMFNAFDVTQIGYLDLDGIENICKYLGQPITEFEKSPVNLLKNKDKTIKMDFNEFWIWWCKHSQIEKNASHTFAMVSTSFSVPYHQQQLTVEETGEIFTPNYRVNYYFKNMETNEKKQISPWHDIPLYIRDIVRTIPESIPANKYNFICEIPKWTRAKFEIATSEIYNPIKQDIKNGVPRFYKHGDMMWNYRAFPQTWESTEHSFIDNIKGDNDPLDAIEIGMTQFKTGSVISVKILGVLGMIDYGQMDWKVICISHSDPIAKFLDEIEDIPKFLPGCLEAIREWLRVYKICQGGVENKFAFDGEYKDKNFAMKLTDDSHHMWANLNKIRDTKYFK
jgi:inorganic pyrophosphatase